MATKAPKQDPSDEGASSAGMTAAQAAALFKRRVVERKDGAESTFDYPLEEAEVLSFKDYGTHVVLVTTDGQKFSNAKA